MAETIPKLREIPISQVRGLRTLPKPRIKTDYDIEVWRTTRSFQDYAIFLRRLNEAVVGQYLPWNSTPSQAITKIIELLDILDSWIDEIPPQESPQRFGNLAFRTWGARLEERVDNLLSALVPGEFSAVIPHVKPLLLTSFGSFTRMDYGTGHETSFALFLLCLTLVRFLHPVEAEERNMVFLVFVRYLRLCWKLQDTYRLEPAGSHGVWGLDDSSFLGYIFGSGQLRDQTEIPVSAVLQPSLPQTNLYFMQITRIRQVKFGPFHEHSSQLHSIAVGVPNWNKVNSGLFKMYEAEVLGKRVVVQHLPLGGLLEWDSGSSASDNAILPPSSGGHTPMKAPWART
ncbi:Serine/threonine-protein phosphatase 2A activator 1 [Hypsizygus marmoreus]|uniref:Serine/threonine-protein phosphatase 2A activator n=1 Tax=Hypsizygus marmoreus TaxID=39966 RepID=A0A369K486_HYPMA|nr:Serine/threonine-protein phosphatase 2A activator 1 [Hypsizygus marmoreus]